MGRPCADSHPDPSLTQGRCHLCWLATHDAGYQEAWGLTPTGVRGAGRLRAKLRVAGGRPPPVGRVPCRHEGPVVTHAGGCCADEAARQLAHVRHCLLESAPWDTCTRGANNGRDAGIAACTTCPHHAPVETVTLNMGAGGIGDGLQGLLAAAGLKADDPARFLDYRVGPNALPFVSLFAGHDRLREHAYDHHGTKPLGGPDRQLNDGYLGELATRGKEARWERYRRNAGATQVAIPPLRDPDGVRRLGSDFPGHVALAPFTNFSDREWSLMHWLALERRLMEGGRKVVVLDAKAERLSQFKGARVGGQPAARVAGVIANAACFVGNDSGMSHLAGLLGTPAVVLCGPTRGESIFGCYPSVTWVDGDLDCSGCFWQAPFKPSACQPRCPSMQGIGVGKVMREVGRVARG